MGRGRVVKNKNWNSRKKLNFLLGFLKLQVVKEVQRKKNEFKLFLYFGQGWDIEAYFIEIQSFNTTLKNSDYKNQFKVD